MAQTLTKPVFLDETGQNIADKLDDIKQAIIDSAGEFIPLLIRVTTPPTKTTYLAGEELDLTGIVVSLVGSNGAMIDVTAGCTFSPVNGTTLTSEVTSVQISYTYTRDGSTFRTSLAISVRALASIAVTTPPTKTSYFAGETLDLTGLVVTATYEGGSTANVTNSCVFSPDDDDTLTTSDTAISVSYTEGSTTKTSSQAITVIGLESITVTTPPTKTEYKVGETLDLTGMVITASYSDNTMEAVTSQCTFVPANGAILSHSDTSVSVSFTAGVTRTATQPLTVEPHKYGVNANVRSDPSLSRLGDAIGLTFTASEGATAGASDFDDLYPWSDIERVTIDNDVFVKIPKFWVKYAGAESFYIADGPADDCVLHPAFYKGGIEYDYILVGAYETGPGYISQSGQTPINNVSLSDARTAISNKGAGYHVMDIETWAAIQMLILVEIANYNSQLVIGSGYTSGYSSPQTTGGCDNVPNLTGHPSGTYGQVPVIWRGLENLWGNAMTGLDGVIQGGSYTPTPGNLYVCNDPSKYADTITSDYVQLTGSSAYPENGKFITSLRSHVPDFPELFIPTGYSATGSATTYVCDKFNSLSAAGGILSVGGDGLAEHGAGLFAVSNRINPTQTGIKFRMLKLPTT